ncbi:hypothetical protein ABNF65_08400 [Paenibacillus larvae]
MYTIQDKLDLLNCIEILDYDADGEVVYYALIKNTEENRVILRKLVSYGILSMNGTEKVGDLFRRLLRGE